VHFADYSTSGDAFLSPRLRPPIVVRKPARAVPRLPRPVPAFTDDDPMCCRRDVLGGGEIYVPRRPARTADQEALGGGSRRHRLI